MQKGRSFSKSGPFLIELIISILFFSVASAVCMQLFVQAHLVSKESNDTNMAVITAQTAAECIKGTNGSGDKLKEFLGAVQGTDNNVYEVRYDKNWSPISDESYVYKMIIQFDETDNNFVNASINVIKSDNQTSIYTLETKKYIPTV